jgi:two-component system, chemotaxis family, chemotaxis protein CheY
VIALDVMIVDDSLIMIQKLTLMLRQLGHNVVRVCKDGATAVTDYPIVKPHIVTMDITMPGMDGIETMKAILAADPDARVIMVTSHGQEAMVVSALDAGALGYVLKPVSQDRLSMTIVRAMARAELFRTSLQPTNLPRLP